jgi:hypothetical protein
MFLLNVTLKVTDEISINAPDMHCSLFAKRIFLYHFFSFYVWLRFLTAEKNELDRTIGKFPGDILLYPVSFTTFEY